MRSPSLALAGGADVDMRSPSFGFGLAAAAPHHPQQQLSSPAFAFGGTAAGGAAARTPIGAGAAYRSPSLAFAGIAGSPRPGAADLHPKYRSPATPIFFGGGPGPRAAPTVDRGLSPKRGGEMVLGLYSPRPAELAGLARRPLDAVRPRAAAAPRTLRQPPAHLAGPGSSTLLGMFSPTPRDRARQGVSNSSACLADAARIG